jgi:hypothetical protein
MEIKFLDNASEVDFINNLEKIKEHWDKVGKKSFETSLEDFKREWPGVKISATFPGVSIEEILINLVERELSAIKRY